MNQGHPCSICGPGAVGADSETLSKIPARNLKDAVSIPRLVVYVNRSMGLALRILCKTGVTGDPMRIKRAVGWVCRYSSAGPKRRIDYRETRLEAQAEKASGVCRVYEVVIF